MIANSLLFVIFQECGLCRSDLIQLLYIEAIFIAEIFGYFVSSIQFKLGGSFYTNTFLLIENRALELSTKVSRFTPPNFALKGGWGTI